MDLVIFYFYYGGNIVVSHISNLVFTNGLLVVSSKTFVKTTNDIINK